MIEKLKENYGITVDILGEKTNVYAVGELLKDMKEKINEIIEKLNNFLPEED